MVHGEHGMICTILGNNDRNKRKFADTIKKWELIIFLVSMSVVCFEFLIAPKQSLADLCDPAALADKSEHPTYEPTAENCIPKHNSRIVLTRKNRPIKTL